ncbi:MAG TPA: putative maltokinase, partial [Rhodocyclaceae bacterium]|nr:putative maltokinase [Rhodocyclaceae bacterium]
MYMAIAQEDRHPIVEIMQQTPDIPESCQWAIFLRNHDELTLEMVTDKERDYMYQMYAADPRARVNLGIRRRLAPLMSNDIDRIRLMNALLFSMPGSPVIYYGDELGMGDNVYLGDRNGVRTPMQWSPDRNGGFSRVDPQGLYLPPIMDPVYGYESVNVESQTRDTSSLLSWTRRLLSMRKSHAAFGRGSLTFLRPGNRKILAYVRSYDGEHLLCVANLSRTAQPVELNLSAHKGRTPVELLGRTPFPPIGDLPYMVTLPGHGFYWFRLSDSQEAPIWHEEMLQREETPMLVFFDGWASLFPERVAARRGAMANLLRRQFEYEALPRFLPAQRWYAGDKTPARANLLDHALWVAPNGSWLLGLYRAETVDGTEADHGHDYFIPLSLVWDSEEERTRALHSVTVARIRQHAHIGRVGDAMADEQFVRATVAAIGSGMELPCSKGHIRYVPGTAYGHLKETDLTQLPVRRPGNETSNSTVALGHLLFLKIYRRVQHGISPELEVGRYLTEVAHFANGVPLMGSMEYHADDGTTSVLALLQGYVENQGDGWSYTLDYLARSFETSLAAAAASEGATSSPAEAHGAYLALIETLGRRTAELHLALAMDTDNPAFKPEPLHQSDLQGLAQRIDVEAGASIEQIWNLLPTLPEAARGLATDLMARRKVLKQRIADAVPQEVTAQKTRHHGDFHLGQVLLAQNDFIIIDFEGEPTRPIEQRREKHSPLRDVAGMLRSFDYAARIALFNLDGKHERETGALDKLAEEWRQETEQTFLKSYAERIDNPALYGDWERSRGLLDLFLLEKALYELRYELSHRSEWVEIPLRGLLKMMGEG